MNRKIMIIGGGILFVIISIVTFNFFKPRGGQALTKQYDFISVRPMTLTETVDATGQVQALEKKDLYADYDGVVEQVNFHAGDRVKKGDIILSISSAPLKQQWQEADSALKQAQVNLNLTMGQLATELAINRVSTSNALQLENYYKQVALYKEQVAQARQ